ncbi:DNA (cytosine-5-)-methyltransferase [Flavobacterium macrobrachii]|uniref:Cytosine-specific methyltransferase n=1 Tax=Flavobacterium macrobrachii TaxID=591204 RepID=A0ABS2CW18_9FLAO|nr:DNA (cytosine-5-)-methyltransferase [Flavobacterium macrobrachii]MBM6499159.1 DNA (cytosine-5-)-methyltransferase [Flavobacterium macrobrachii]
MENKIKVIELFAGVGGFRLGLEGWNNKSASSNYKEDFESPYEVVWSNQWEPSTKVQHASMVYENRFGKNGHSNKDIASVEVSEIPDHDLLVGGFPCQDYSVATTLKNSKGLIGKKGVLWWSIHKILSEKENKPKYLFLENVDRLLISPSGQRGRDFAIILKSLNDLGYAVEWRVVNAAEYGMPQRRRRIFILAYSQNSTVYNEIKETNSTDWLLKDGTLANAFPVQSDNILFPNEFQLKGDIVEISENFNKNGKKGMFENTGIMIDGIVTTIKTKPSYEDQFTVLKDIIQNGEVTEEFYIKEEELDKWFYLKGAKKEMRKNSQGFEYNYSEGGMIFPDPLDKPSRTIITGEGGKSASRFKHVIKTEKGYRRLSPVELERLNMFPDNHSKLDGITDTKRAFFMGNALVVGVIEKIGVALNSKIKNSIYDFIT